MINLNRYIKESQHTKITVGYCNAKLGRKEVFKPVTGNWGLHEI